MLTRRGLLRRGGIAVATVTVAGCSNGSGASNAADGNAGTGRGPPGAESVDLDSVARAVRATPIVADERVYAAETLGNLYALDRATGAVEWTFEMDGTVSAPAVDGDRLYVGDYGPGESLRAVRGSDGTAYAVDRHTGEALWETDVAGNPVNTPVVRDGTVYYGALGDGVHALDAASGARQWTHGFASGTVFRSWPFAAGDVVYAAGRRRLFALDVASRETRWTTDPMGPFGGAAFDGDRLFVGTSGRLVALDRSSGEEVWSADEPTVAGVAAGDSVYAAVSRGTELVAFDPESGTEQWATTVSASPNTPSVGDGSVYVPTTTGRIHVLDAADGAERQSFTLGEASSGTATPTTGERELQCTPAVADGLLYVGDETGTVHAVDPETGRARWLTTLREAV